MQTSNLLVCAFLFSENSSHFPLLKAIMLTASNASPAIPLESAMEAVYRDSKQLGLHKCNWGQNPSWQIRVLFQKGDVIPHEISQIPGKNVWLSLRPCDLFCWPAFRGWKPRLRLNNKFALFMAQVAPRYRSEPRVIAEGWRGSKKLLSDLALY